MLNFVPDIGSSQVIVKSFRVIFNLNFLFHPCFIFPLNKLLFKLVRRKGLNEAIKFLLLVVSGRSARVDEYFRTQDSCEDFRLISLIFLDVDDDEKVEVLALIVVGSGRKLHGAEVNLAINHLHFRLAANAHIQEGKFIISFIVSIFLDSEELGLNEIRIT